MDNYIIIPTWMLKSGLQGNELYAYAIIYQSSQLGLGHYSGGAKYLANTLGISEQEAGRIIMKLLDNGFILTDAVLFKDETSAYKYNPDKDF